MTDYLSPLLIPHDGSVLSGRCAEILGPLLRTGAQVTLLHVDDGQSLDEIAVAAAKSALEAQGATVSVRTVVSGDASGAILEAAAEIRPRLVAMSSHGRSGIQRVTRGSVAARVLRGCPVPVFMTNPYTQASGAAIDSVLVPVDGSEASGEVLDSAIPFAQAFGARVALLYVDWLDPTDTPARAAKRREVRRVDIEEWLSSPRARVSAAGLEVSVEVAHGNVAEEILRLAESGGHDVLAMSTHGRTGPGRWLLGSTAETVLRHCALPLLLHRVGNVTSA